jgi:hypothetical protein
MALLKFLSGMGAVLIFGIAIFMFMINFIGTNNPDALIDSSNPFINESLSELQERADELQELGTTSKERLEADTPSPVYVFLIILSAFTVPLGFLAILIKGIGTVLVITFTSLFGQGASPYYTILAVINGIILITIVILIIREIRGRS